MPRAYPTSTLSTESRGSFVGQLGGGMSCIDGVACAARPRRIELETPRLSGPEHPRNTLVRIIG